MGYLGPPKRWNFSFGASQKKFLEMFGIFDKILPKKFLNWYFGLLDDNFFAQHSGQTSEKMSSDIGVVGHGGGGTTYG